MGKLSIPPPQLARRTESRGLALSGSSGPAACPTAAKTFWTSDTVLAGIGLVLLLAGFAAKSTDPWILWIGLPTAAGLVLYLCLPAIQRYRKIESWQDQRSALLAQWSLVVDNLSTAAEKRYSALHDRISRLGDLFPQPDSGSLLRPGEYMLWLYLKLLLARDHIEETVRTSHEDQITAQRDALLTELETTTLTATTRQSKEETLLILDQRIVTIQNRAGRIQEIESDITRVEQWVALMHDQAAQHNAMGDAGRSIHFASDSLTLPSLDSLPGSSIQQLDAQISSQAFR
jgi:hypothetical protein